MTIIGFEHRVDNVLTDVTGTPVLSSPDNSYGVKRADTMEVVVANATAMTRISAGVYEYEVTDPEGGLTYDYWVEYTYDAETNHIHFQAAGEDAAGSKTLHLVVVADGEIQVLDDIPLLRNPTKTYGVASLETGNVVVASGAEFTHAGEGDYSYLFAEPADDLVYRYYCEVQYGGAKYHLPRTTAYVKSACLVIGRYTTSHAIEQEYGVDNVHKWLGVDDHDEATDYALRFYDFIKGVESELDDAVRDGGSTVPFTDEIPDIIKRVATLWSGVRAYESRGVSDVDQASGRAMHRLRFQSGWCREQLAKIRGGSLRIATDDAVRYPTAVNDCLSSDLTDNTY